AVESGAGGPERTVIDGPGLDAEPEASERDTWTNESSPVAPEPAGATATAAGSDGTPAIEQSGERRRMWTTLPPLGEGVESIIRTAADTQTLAAGGVEVSTGVANVVVDQPLEHHLETPTAIDRAIEELGDAGGEKRAETMAKELEALADGTAAAMLAY